MYDDPNDVLQQYTTEPEWVREADRERLIPTGTYEGQIVQHATRIGDRDPFINTPLVRLTVELYNVDGVAQRNHFFDVCPVKVTQRDGKQRSESRLWTQLAKVTDTVGKTATDTVTQAKLGRYRFRIRLSEAQGEYEARNWTDSIAAIRT